MTTGTKSLLFGAHQFILHPLFVLITWIKLYGWPDWKEAVCILVHDWGYWGSENMDDEHGENHPIRSAKIARKLFGFRGYEYTLISLHSRHLAKQISAEPSKLCWADKLSITFDPWWLYIPRAWASGELHEYRKLAAKKGAVPLSASHRRWFTWARLVMRKIAEEQRGDAVPYINNERQ